jgi:hypothetical protein
VAAAPVVMLASGIAISCLTSYAHTPHAGPAWDPHGTQTALPIL